jgi:2-dehydro-3-deoxygluconokinase
MAHPSPPLRIACVGEAMVELSLSPDGRHADVGFGGDTLNTAVYLARSGAAVAFVSVIGTDPLSDRMAEFIAAEGVSTAHLARDATRGCGLYAISTDAAGERSFAYWRDTSAARRLFADGDFAALEGFRVIHLSAVTLAILPEAVRAGLFGWLAGFRARGGLVSFDSNYRPRLWPDPASARAAVARAWTLSDIGLPSLDDERALFGDADAGVVLARLRAAGVRAGALKRGAAGPLSLAPLAGPPPVFAPAPRVVDTTAAGDAFDAGFLAAHLAGAGAAAAMAAGHALALRVIGHRGAIVARTQW